jgi:hypothetical protein
VVRTQNFLGFSMSSGFFIAVIFSVINFNNPVKVVIVSLMVTFVFYMMLVVGISLFMRTYSHKQTSFKKAMYEDESNNISRLLLDRENKIDKVLHEIENIDFQAKN